ncbi:MAG TPA: UbiD family decarboxylase [Methylomirabilota bacterium]|nr:UbiD family decarboxylase [Methylomirabilota bacterium]
MRPSFRDVIARLDREGVLLRLGKEVDARHLSALTVKADRPVLFDRVRGFEVRVAGGLFWSRRRLAAALGWPEAELGTRFAAGVRTMIEPETGGPAPAQEVVRTGRDVDLTALPIPLLAEKDGGPYISAGVVMARSGERGLNAGVYRLMFRTRDELGIDLVTVSDMRRLYERHLQRQAPLPLSVSLGVHPIEILSAAYKAPPGVSEMAIAGGLHGSPVPLVPCWSVDVPAIADAEIVLEGELLPIGWTEDEGPFGEFAGMYGDLKHNPVFKVTAITHRRGPIFQLLQMPWENAWLGAAATEAQVWNVLKTAGVDVVNVCVTEGSACRWSVIASIRKRAGGGKNALLAILSLPDTKHALVVDEDVDIFDATQVEWARTFRVQADKDVFIIAGAQAKHVDPSVRPWELSPGQLPMTAKMGIDATIPEGIPATYYERIRHTWVDDVRLEDY